MLYRALILFVFSAHVLMPFSIALASASPVATLPSKSSVEPSATDDDAEFELYEVPKKYAVKDPFEVINRQTFRIVLGLDRYVVRPLSRGYTLLPNYVKIGVSNSTDTLNQPLDAISHLMVFDINSASRSMTRVLVNTIFGLFGTIDVAGEFGFAGRARTFGDVWRFYELPVGPYIVTPVGFGTTADLLNLIQSNFIAAKVYGNIFPDDQYIAVRYGGMLAGIISIRAQNAMVIDSTYIYSPDLYASIRLAYYSRLNVQDNRREPIVPNDYQYVTARSIDSSVATND